MACVCTCGGDVPALQPIRDADPYANTIELLSELHADVEDSEGVFSVVARSADIERCLDEGQIGLLPAIEGASPIQGDVGRLMDLVDRGIRVIGLTWNSRNEIAVGLEAGDGGLSSFGARAVEVMNRRGVIIDLAHASEATFWDVARESVAPLVDTHSNAKAVWDHARNLSDHQLDAIGASGGVVGLCLYPSFVGEQPVTVEMVAKHASYLASHIGIDAVVIGADFIDYALEEIVGDLSAHGDLYPADSFTYPVGVETAAGLQALMRGLRRGGFDDSMLRKIGIDNFLRVYAQTERIAGLAWRGP